MSKEWKAVAWSGHEKTSIIAGDTSDWCKANLVADCYTSEDDARVMAASIELLEALQGILAVASVRIDDPRIAQWDAARAAIAKATGSAT